MKNYKSVLKISVKPESVVAYYLIFIGFIGMGLMVLLTQINAYVLLCLLPMGILFYLAWRKYYQLLKPNSVLGLIISDDEISVECRNGKTHKVILIDQLHINRWVLFVFADFSSESNKLIIQREGVLFAIKKQIYDVILTAYKELIYFLSYRKMIIVISEQSMGASEYRELLRRSERMNRG